MDEEFIAPGVEGLEGAAVGDIEGENTAVGSSVESDSQGLESFLSRSVPNLQTLIYGNQTSIGLPA